MLDGLVVSAPGLNNGPIIGGQAQITGNFTQAEATDLANVLKFGALPLTFDAGRGAGGLGHPGRRPAQGRPDRRRHRPARWSSSTRCSTTAASAWSPWPACSSSAIITYGLVVLLGWQIGFRLSLAGIAGLIVAIGITADSFVVYFERMRDEVRDGRTLRVAVETGWVRARRTILAADFVSFLAAVVLYVLSVGSVRGFAFTLGLTTLIDIVVVFMFTKPLVTMLARTKFFGQGHKLSGLDPERLGATKRTRSRPRPAADAGQPPAPRRSTARRPDEPPGHLGARLYRGEVSYDFIGRRKVWYTVSAVILLVISIVSLLFRGLTLGIEFRGGAEFRVTSPTVTEDDRALDRAGRRRQRPRSSCSASATNTVRAQTETLHQRRARGGAGRARRAVRASAATPSAPSSSGRAGARTSPRRRCAPWSSSCSSSSIFLSLYFEWKMALAAMIALLHDLVITAGLYSLVGFEVTPATVIGFLTILGYSLYDTVVVFDKVRENTAGLAGGSRMTYSQAANLAVNQTLVRSINTSIIALLPIAAILFAGVVLLGAGPLKDLALALFVGVAVGAYSSIFIATAAAGRLQGARARDAGARQAGRQPAHGQAGATTPSRGAAPRRPSRRRPTDADADDRGRRRGRREPRRRRAAAARGRRRRRGGPAGGAPAQPAAQGSGGRNKSEEAAMTDAADAGPTAPRLLDQGPRRPRLPQPGHRLQGHHAAARRRRTPSPRSSTALAAPLPRRRPSTRSSASRPAASSSPRRSPWRSAPASCRCARRASCPATSSRRRTTWSTARRPSR